MREVLPTNSLEIDRMQKTIVVPTSARNGAKSFFFSPNSLLWCSVRLGVWISS